VDNDPPAMRYTEPLRLANEAMLQKSMKRLEFGWHDKFPAGNQAAAQLPLLTA